MEKNEKRTVIICCQIYIQEKRKNIKKNLQKMRYIIYII